jgi:hypothetical protein
VATHYIIFSSADEAEARSRAAWIDKAGCAVDLASGTIRLWELILHPTNGQAALIVDDTTSGLLTPTEGAALIDALPAGWSRFKSASAS